MPSRIRPRDLYQPSDTPVDVALWLSEYYPEGARSKELRYCLPDNIQPFLLASHPYLFKKSNERRPGAHEQFYCEVIAFIVGEFINVEVPPAFVAFNSDTDECGALIQWFYKPGGGDKYLAKFVHGTEYGLRMTKNFDPWRGKRHSANLMFCLCRHFGARNHYLTAELFEHWFKVFAFDALIGNTDRHSHNWGVLFIADLYREFMQFSPAFDNGTSLGWEIPPDQFPKFENPEHMNRYIARGYHHVKWLPGDEKQCGHLELLQILCKRYPASKTIMLRALTFDMDVLESKIRPLTAFELPVRLSKERCQFIIKLLRARQKYLLAGLQ